MQDVQDSNTETVADDIKRDVKSNSRSFTNRRQR